MRLLPALCVGRCCISVLFLRLAIVTVRVFRLRTLSAWRSRLLLVRCTWWMMVVSGRLRNLRGLWMILSRGIGLRLRLIMILLRLWRLIWAVMLGLII